jgi:hypothetical protein
MNEDDHGAAAGASVGDAVAVELDLLQFGHDPPR